MKEAFDPFSLRGKNILVTGASSGIGKEIAILCSQMGGNVIITGRNEERLNETFGLLVGEKNQAFPADLSVKSEIERLVSRLTQIDGVVLAAGIVEMWPTQFATTEKFNKIFQTNLFSPIELLRLIIKKKKFNDGLSVVAIDSIAGNDDFSVGNSIYGAGKAALKSFLKFFAVEMVGKGIRVNTISPGLILTPMQTRGAVGEEDLEKAIERVPMKRWGLPKDIAPAAVFLLSGASSYMTASDIKIDGGYTI